MRVHLIKKKDYDIAFFCDTLEIKKVSHEEGRRLEERMEEEVHEEREKQEPFFSTLVLHVTNCCNMYCEYCFAGHGSYRSKEGVMSEQTALDAVHMVYGRYRSIEEIKFFGGEPLLNISVMEAVCKEVCGMYQAGVIDSLPSFRVITNGTILNEEILRVIKEYGIKVVISMDGPGEIHDRARIDRCGKGTHEKICENIRLLQKETDGKQPYAIELTYSQAHVDAGCSLKDVTRYFVEEFGLPANKVNISPVTLSPEHPLYLQEEQNCLVDSVTDVMEEIRKSGQCYADQKLTGLINRLKKKRISSNCICSAGSSWLAVSSTGRVYPCLMFMDNEKFYMGEAGEGIWEEERFQTVQEWFTSYEKRAHQPCSHCFANKICSCCAGINDFSTGSIYAMGEKNCGIMKKRVELAIEGIAEGLF